MGYYIHKLRFQCCLKTEFMTHLLVYTYQYPSVYCSINFNIKNTENKDKEDANYNVAQIYKKYLLRAIVYITKVQQLNQQTWKAFLFITSPLPGLIWPKKMMQQSMFCIKPLNMLWITYIGMNCIACMILKVHFHIFTMYLKASMIKIYLKSK